MTWDLADWRRMAPGEIAVSDWIAIDQARVDQFAEATGHTHWLHTDPVRAAVESPAGGTLAHGFLILSLINHAIDLCGLRPTDSPFALNYGCDKVRFLKPMPVGNGFKVRDRIAFIDARDHPKGVLARTGHTFEIAGSEDMGPAVVAEYLCVWTAA